MILSRSKIPAQRGDLVGWIINSYFAGKAESFTFGWSTVAINLLQIIST